MLAVLFIDLDKFKAINDDMGHSAGDVVLIQVATRLRHCVRIGDTVARLGGDEFAVLSEGLKEADQVRAVAERILLSLAKPYDVDGQRVVVTGSVGISVYERGMTGLDQLLRSADNAMYEAKATGRDRYVMAPVEGGVIDEANVAVRVPDHWRGTRA